LSTFPVLPTLHPISTLFPYTTLFRSVEADGQQHRHGRNVHGYHHRNLRRPDSYDDGRSHRERLDSHSNSHDAVVQLSDRITGTRDRKSTRLNSSHRTTSYAVFCLKKK